MGADTKATAPNDEIAEIMNEIQSLQQSMAAHADPEPSLDAQAPEPAPASLGEPQALDEFRGSADDASMEETLANLKEEPDAAPNSLLDASEGEEPSAGPIEAEMAMEAVQAEADFDSGVGLDSEHEEETPRKYTPSRVRAASDFESSQESPESPESPESQDGALTLTLSGKMTLNLKYEFEGQDVKIQFRDGCLHVELVDGTEFKVPVGSKRLKAA